uniref:Uncharacterized protein n=1 Tax=Anguilla anguilla TaxID=7936 RepID=A0A0E9XFR8_ANGAN
MDIENSLEIKKNREVANGYLHRLEEGPMTQTLASESLCQKRSADERRRCFADCTSDFR